MDLRRFTSPQLIIFSRVVTERTSAFNEIEFLDRTGLLLAVGLAVGLLLAVWAARAAATLLFGLQPHDPVTLISAVLLLAAVALAASYGPARRAAALEPMQALHDE